jgi:hypothetical protein
MATLAKLGMTIPDARSRILALSFADYVEAESSRSDGSQGQAWVFGAQVRSVLVYIKVLVRLERAQCVCISFHEPTKPIVFPFSENR